jgi:hypothetical protein
MNNRRVTSGPAMRRAGASLQQIVGAGAWQFKRYLRRLRVS